MPMKRFSIISAFLLVAAGLYAQQINDALKASLQTAAEAVTQWDTETMLDSLDQEELPRLESGGVMGGVNFSHFIIISG